MELECWVSGGVWPPCVTRCLASATLSSDLGRWPPWRLLLQLGQRVALLNGAQLLLLRSPELGGVSDLGEVEGRALAWLESPPCSLGKGKPPRGAWDCGTSGGREAGVPGCLEHDIQPGRVPSRKQGNAHHLDDLRLPLILQAAFQVLGAALLLLLDTQGKGIGSGSRGGPGLPGSES